MHYLKHESLGKWFNLFWVSYLQFKFIVGQLNNYFTPLNYDKFNHLKFEQLVEVEGMLQKRMIKFPESFIPTFSVRSCSMEVNWKGILVVFNRMT